MPRLLTISSLFPNPAQPVHGTFVAQRLQRLLELPRFDGSVIAPVPWFPRAWPWPGRYAQLAAVPRSHDWLGEVVHHPRFATVPALGKYVAPLSMAWGMRGVFRQTVAQRNVDVIDAHYLYPDGVAAAVLARAAGLPYVLTARGTDVNVLLQMPVPQRWLRWSFAGASAVIGVSEALTTKMRPHVPASVPLLTLRNGVDLDHFAPTTEDVVDVGTAGTKPRSR